MRRFSVPYFPVFGPNYLSVFSPSAGKYGTEKLQIRALFTQWLFQTEQTMTQCDTTQKLFFVSSKTFQQLPEFTKAYYKRLELHFCGIFSIKDLGKCILCILCTQSLIFFIRIYLNLDFLLVLVKNQFFVFLYSMLFGYSVLILMPS